MNERWTDFERFVFKELGSISKRLSKLEGRANAWGALAGTLSAIIVEAVATALRHH